MRHKFPIFWLPLVLQDSLLCKIQDHNDEKALSIGHPTILTTSPKCPELRAHLPVYQST